MSLLLGKEVAPRTLHGIFFTGMNCYCSYRPNFFIYQTGRALGREMEIDRVHARISGETTLTAPALLVY